MKINRQELLNVLIAVKPGLASKEVIEQATHFIFNDEEVYTYNDRISINTYLDTSLSTTPFAIQGKELFTFLEKVKEDEVDIQIDVEKSKLKIKAGKTTANLVIDTDIKIPEINIPDFEDWEPLPENFTEAIKFCLFSTSKNMTKLALACLNVKKDCVESSDNYRITKKDLTSKINTPFLLPGSAAEQLKTYNAIDYHLDSTWIHFCNAQDVVFSCRRVEVDFPNVSPLMEVEGDKVELPKELISAIDKAGILAVSEFDHDRYITVELKKNKLNVKGEGQLGWVSEEIPIKYKGAAHKIKVHPDHFIDILQHLKQMVIGENTLLFEGEGFKHAISFVV
jgi:DNA polymerase III sliding clamp (beta) subunit (PCNA family)